MIKSKFAILTHIVTFLAKYNEDWISSSHLAKSINTNPTFVRKVLKLLKDAGYITSKEGKDGGVRLSKAASKIKLSEIFILAKGEENVLGYAKNEGYEGCAIGSQIKDKLGELYVELDELMMKKLMTITLEEFKNRF